MWRFSAFLLLSKLCYQKILELCGDDWEVFLHYLGCLFEDDSSWSCETINVSINPPKFVECKLAHLTDEVFDSCVENASAFVQKLQAETSNDSLRNPFLAHLEIERRKCLFRKNNDDLMWCTIKIISIKPT
ncbi:N-terminal acetyltransferase B complex auxiliary subunit NAA25-like [Hibiscus syriacus]|uniref:N-terminal acetyltransferase B complex auxiliary subunit NAA25-like n=1 Tax=Hibiscus syriacus TaxID=106335 RepID=UPI001922B332|nr:N-terminal acetyltransferase B complex auxiliary subunit NAA25-like [Hibiscus syriacus]